MTLKPLVSVLSGQQRFWTNYLNCNVTLLNVSDQNFSSSRLAISDSVPCRVIQTVMSIYDLEKPDGIVLSMGGQLPNNIAMDLHRQRVSVVSFSQEHFDRHFAAYSKCPGTDSHRNQ